MLYLYTNQPLQVDHINTLTILNLENSWLVIFKNSC